MRKRTLLAVVAVAVGLAGAGGAAVAVADPAGPDEKFLDRKLSALSQVADAPAVAEVRSGDEVWSGAEGARVDGGDEAARPDDHVRIGSLTKSMISVVVLQLEQEGKLKLDDSVQELIPGVLPYEDPITVRQLLNHTSGVPDYFVDLYPSLAEGSADDVEANKLDQYTPAEIIDLATQRPLDFAPGAEYRYSNTGYFTLGVLIEQLTDDTVQQQVSQRVLEPVGLAETTLPEQGTGIAGDHLNAYLDVGAEPGRERIDTTEFEPSQFWAAGVAQSNQDDVNKLYRALFDGTLLDEDQLEQMREFTEQSQDSYGLGLVAIQIECPAVPDGVAMGHTGGTLGHSTYSFHSPDGHTQVSFTLGSDPQLMPAEASEPVSDAVVDLIVAGLCGDTGAKYSHDIDPDVIDDPLTAVKP